MCQLLYIGSTFPLQADPKIREATEVWERCENVRLALPQARRLYQLGGCQCYFSYSDEQAIARIEAQESVRLKERKDTRRVEWRSHLESCNRYIVAVADFLRDSRANTPLWLLWVWEREENHPQCSRWACPPSYFLRQDFQLPAGRSVIEILTEGPPELICLDPGGSEVSAASCPIQSSVE